MSAAPSLALEKGPRRGSPRHPINSVLDVIVLRSGVPENLPGRCTDLSEGGVGGMVAGELSAGQQVAVELRLPNVGVPVRARASVRYQGHLRCGFEFVGLSIEQREMIRYWAYRLASSQTDEDKAEQKVDASPEPVVAKPGPQIKLRKKHFNFLIFAMLVLAGLVWWQWQRSWRELEIGAEAAEETPLRVAPETMAMRIVSRVEPLYPEEARRAGKEGLAVLDAVVAPDGSVKRLKAVSGDDLLVKAAEEAVRLWKFEPYQSSGRAVPVETTITIEFRLN
jgi:TonB family protein